MSEEEYIAVLWRIIYALGGIVIALLAVVWRHILIDRERALDIQRCKDALGINGVKR